MFIVRKALKMEIGRKMGQREQFLKSVKKDS